MNLEEAKKRARAYIKELAKGDKDYEWKLINGMLILEDAIKGDI
jgi:hypothetical protein